MIKVYLDWNGITHCKDSFSPPASEQQALVDKIITW